MLATRAAMVQLEIPHINVISKMDMVRKKRSFMERFYQPDGDELAAELNRDSNPNLARFVHAPSCCACRTFTSRWCLLKRHVVIDGIAPKLSLG